MVKLYLGKKKDVFLGRYCFMVGLGFYFDRMVKKSDFYTFSSISAQNSGD